MGALVQALSIPLKDPALDLVTIFEKLDHNADNKCTFKELLLTFEPVIASYEQTRQVMDFCDTPSIYALWWQGLKETVSPKLSYKRGENWNFLEKDSERISGETSGNSSCLLTYTLRQRMQMAHVSGAPTCMSIPHSCFSCSCFPWRGCVWLKHFLMIKLCLFSYKFEMNKTSLVMC